MARMKSLVSTSGPSNEIARLPTEQTFDSTPPPMHPVNRVNLAAFPCLLALVWFVGCAAPVRTVDNSPAVTLLVRLVGGGTLTPQQLTNIHQAVQGDITDAGYRFAPNTDAADFLVTVRFTPDALDPSAGHIAITGIEPNPLNRRGSSAKVAAPAETMELHQKMKDVERWIQTQPKSPTPGAR